MTGNLQQFLIINIPCTISIKLLSETSSYSPGTLIKELLFPVDYHQLYFKRRPVRNLNSYFFLSLCECAVHISVNESLLLFAALTFSTTCNESNSLTLTSTVQHAEDKLSTSQLGGSLCDTFFPLSSPHQQALNLVSNRFIIAEI